MNKIWHSLALVAASTALLIGCDGGNDSPQTQSLGAEQDDDGGQAKDGGAETDARCLSSTDDTSDRAATIEAWKARCATASNFGAVEGTCADGTVLLDFLTGTSNEWRHFDADGRFIAVEYSSDAPDSKGCDRAYFPEPIHCEAPFITTILCPTNWVRFNVGDRLVH